MFQSLVITRLFARKAHLLFVAMSFLFPYPYLLGVGEGQPLVIINSGCSLAKSIDEFVASARTYEEKALYFLAIKDYSCAIEIDPQRMKLYRLRAGVLIMVGQFERAIDDIKKVLEAEPHNYIPHALLYMAYFEQGKFSEALAEIDTVLELNDADSYSYLIRGQIYVKLNNKAKALEAFNHYFQLQKYSIFEAKGYAEIGFAYEHFGDAAAAQTYLKQAVALHADVGSLYLSTAQTYRARSNFATALENLNKAIRLTTPELAAAYYERAAVYIGLQNDSSALNDCSQIIQLQPQKPEGYVCKGVVLTDLRQNGQAINNFNHAIELDKKFIAAYSGRAFAEINTADYDLALLDLNFAITSEPLVSNHYRLRAQVYTSVDNAAAAIADYETYLRLQGGAEVNPDIVDNIHRLKETLANL